LATVSTTVKIHKFLAIAGLSSNNVATCIIRVKNLLIRNPSDVHFSVESNWFGLTTLYDWLKKTRATLSTNQKNKTNRDAHAHLFPRFVSASCISFLRVLIGPMASLPFLVLAKVKT